MQLTETEIYEIIKEEVKNFLDETIETVQEVGTQIVPAEKWTEPGEGYIDDSGNFVYVGLTDPRNDPPEVSSGRAPRMRNVAKGKDVTLHGHDVKRLSRASKRDISRRQQARRA